MRLVTRNLPVAFLALTLSLILLPWAQPFSLLLPHQTCSCRRRSSNSLCVCATLCAKPPKPRVDYEDLYPDGDAFDKTKPRDGKKYAGKNAKAELKRRLKNEVNNDSRGDDNDDFQSSPDSSSSILDSAATAFSIQVPAPASVIRLDKHLSTLLPSVSRSFLQSRLSAGAFTADDAYPLTKTTKLKPGQAVTYTPPSPLSSSSSDPSAEAMKVLFKSPNVAVLSKPYGVLTHVGANNWDHGATVSGEAERIFNIPESEFAEGAGGSAYSLYDADVSADAGQAAAVGTCGSPFETLFLSTLTSRALRRPGIVHRLDATTTGCIIVASNRPTVGFLSEQFKERRVGKLYLARVRGKMSEVRRLHLPVKRDATDATKMAVASGGKSSDTIVKPLEFDAGAGNTLVAVVILTGRTHQIRLALAHVGYPIVGDRKYNSRVKAEVRSIERRRVKRGARAERGVSSSDIQHTTATSEARSKGRTRRC